MKKRERYEKGKLESEKQGGNKLPIFLLLISMLRFLAMVDILLHPNFTGCERRNQLQWRMCPLVAYGIALSSQRRDNNYEKQHTERHQRFKSLIVDFVCLILVLLLDKAVPAECNKHGILKLKNATSLPMSR
jgi:hypothetical protein